RLDVRVPAVPGEHRARSRRRRRRGNTHGFRRRAAGEAGVARAHVALARHPRVVSHGRHLAFPHAVRQPAPGRHARPAGARHVVAIACVDLSPRSRRGIIWHRPRVESAAMRKHSNISAQVTCEVAFSDVDLQEMIDSGYLWPIVDLHVKYVRAARFADRLQVRASLVEWEQRLAINYLVTDLADGARVVRAQTVQVAV